MTLSEFIAAARIRALLEGRSPDNCAPVLECGSGLRVSVQAGAVCGFPRKDDGPWVGFEVRLVAGTPPAEWEPWHGPRTLPVSAVVRLLRDAGWPRALGVDNRKSSRPVPATE